MGAGRCGPLVLYLTAEAQVACTISSALRMGQPRFANARQRPQRTGAVRLPARAPAGRRTRAEPHKDDLECALEAVDACLASPLFALSEGAGAGRRGGEPAADQSPPEPAAPARRRPGQHGGVDQIGDAAAAGSRRCPPGPGSPQDEGQAPPTARVRCIPR